jgi:hypothetical protein
MQCKQQPSAHAQVLQRSQAAQARWDAATELVAEENAAGTYSAAPKHHAVQTTSASAHAQVLQRSQAAQAQWYGAAELVCGEIAAGTYKRSASAQFNANNNLRRTHSCTNSVRLPRLDGMLPLSWLL